MLLPRHFLKALTGRGEVEAVHLVVSAGASQVLRHELGAARTGVADLVEAACLLPEETAKLTIHRDTELDAPIASGSYRLDGTVILPLSAGTLGALATGAARTLVQRAGAVALKERWPLVLGFRETPLSLIHIENLRRLIHAGAIIVPPIPAFYIQADEGTGHAGIDRFLDHYALRLFDQLGLNVAGEPGLRWPAESPSDPDAGV